MKNYLNQIWRKDRLFEIYARVGNLVSSDDLATMFDKIYILPSFEIAFSRNRFMVTFAWLVFSLHIRYVGYKKKGDD